MKQFEGFLSTPRLEAIARRERGDAAFSALELLCGLVVTRVSRFVFLAISLPVCAATHNLFLFGLACCW